MQLRSSTAKQEHPSGGSRETCLSMGHSVTWGSGWGKLREPAERTLPCFLWAHIPSGLLMVLLFVCGFALSLQTGLIVLRRGISGCRSKIIWPSLQAPSLGDDSSVTPSAPRTRGIFPGVHTRSCELTAHRQLSLRPVHFCCASAGK